MTSSPCFRYVGHLDESPSSAVKYKSPESFQNPRDYGNLYTNYGTRSTDQDAEYIGFSKARFRSIEKESDEVPKKMRLRREIDFVRDLFGEAGEDINAMESRTSELK
jgi:hypothetical protein